MATALPTRTRELEAKLDAASIVFAFSGQGSQTYHMGAALYESHPVFRDWMLTLDGMVRARTGVSVLERLYLQRTHRGDVFDDIRFTHPAIFMVEYSLARVLQASGIEPHALLGASLGEYCAVVLAGMISVEDALESVIAQAEICHRRGSTGGMLAILGPPSLYQPRSALYEHTEIASFNFESSFVLSGPGGSLDRIQAHLNRAGIASQRLPVRQAFHCALIDGVQPDVYRHAERIRSHEPRLPFISCTTACLLDGFSREYFWDVVRKPVQISQAIGYLEARGSHLYLDVGPGGTFANFIKYSAARRVASRACALLTPFGHDMDALEVALAAARQMSSLRRREQQ